MQHKEKESCLSWLLLAPPAPSCTAWNLTHLRRAIPVQALSTYGSPLHRAAPQSPLGAAGSTASHQEERPGEEAHAGPECTQGYLSKEFQGPSYTGWEQPQDEQACLAQGPTTTWGEMQRRESRTWRPLARIKKGTIYDDQIR